MSNHFTYEIDERRLRVKLREMELPASEEAWQSFEAFIGAQTSRNHSTLNNIQLPLNRNVIVPAVFGLLIIVFSVILFRFINIDTATQQPPKEEMSVPASEAAPPQTASAGVSTGSPSATTAGAQSQDAPPTPSVAAKAAITGSLSVAGKSVQTQSAKPVAPTPTVNALPKPVAKSTTTTNAGGAAQPSLAAGQSAITPSAAPEQGAKKKRKRRSAEEVESEPAAETRPVIDADERSVGERPN